MGNPFRSLKPYAPPELDTVMKRRTARHGTNDRAYEAAVADGAEQLECVCECIKSECEARFAVSLFDFQYMRKGSRLAMAPNHVELAFERTWTNQDGWLEVVAPNPAHQGPDPDTLKQHVEHLRSELESGRAVLTATNGRIATSLVTGALVISLVANVLPAELNRVAFGLVLIGIGLFFPIIWFALWRPQDIEEDFIPSGESLKNRLERWEKDPRDSLLYSPLKVGSYEQWRRIDANERAKPGLAYPEVYLREGDYLAVEVSRLQYRLADVTERTKRARGSLSQVHAWLSILVVYLIAIVAVIRLQ